MNRVNPEWYIHAVFYHFSLKEKRERHVMKLLSGTVNVRFLCGLIMKAQKSAVTDASFRRRAPLL